MIRKPVVAVTFDVNGTLIHSPRMGEIYAEILVRHGLQVSPEEALQTVRQVWQEFDCANRPGQDRFATHPEGGRGWWFRFIDRVGEHLGQGQPSPFAKAELYDRFGHAEAWEVFPEVSEVLQSLQAMGLRLAVVSNWDERLPLLLERLGLESRFEVIIYSALVGAEKPLPVIFNRAVEHLQVLPEQILHVGDRRKDDSEGARAAGLQALHLDRSGGSGDVEDLRGLVVGLRPMANPTGRFQER